MREKKRGWPLYFWQNVSRCFKFGTDFSFAKLQSCSDTPITAVLFVTEKCLAAFLRLKSGCSRHFLSNYLSFSLKQDYFHCS